jgi:hypothetical protein
MKLLAGLITVFMLFFAAADVFSADLGFMRISLIEGDVQIKTPDAGDWGYAAVNEPLMEGDEVWVSRGGRVELQLNRGSYIRLDQDSSLQILSMDRDSSQFYLSQGQAYVYYDAPGGNVIQIDTPDSSTRAFDRAIFRVDISGQYQYTDVAVYKGYVETENAVGRTRVNAGQMLSLGPDTDGEVAPMGPPDEWERWNKRRNDRLFERRDTSSRYLPAELRPYSYDFDTYGRWVNVPEYGYCWTPTVFVGSSWAPYREGRWIWIGGDYTWVAYEPWGWAPYHYGRWAFIVNTGWCWVPPLAGDVFWAPGYVGWVWTDNYVGWVPLAPGETYYGRGHHGRHSVNITNINIKQINITNVYKNVNINNGVTIVNRKTFIAGSPKIVNIHKKVIQDDIFTKKNIRAGAPDIRPEKRGYFVSDRSVPSAKLPPQHIRDLQMARLKQSRPHIKEPDKSVMKPGFKPDALPVKTVPTPKTPGMGKPKVQFVHPAEKQKAGIPGRPGPREERGRQIRPSERKPAAPESAPAPGGERRQQVRPSERQPVRPESGPKPREERGPQVRPSERKPAAPEGTPAPGGERRPQVRPSEGQAVTPRGGPAPKEKKASESEKAPQEDQREKGTEEPVR